MAAVNSKGGGETAWAASEIEKASGLAMTLHQLDAFEGLEGADENGRSDSLRLADDVEHEMSAVIEKDIYVARSEIHRTDPRSGTAKMVTGGIAWRIGFGFDDASADPASPEIVDDDFADKEARQLDGFWRKFRALQLAEGEFGMMIAHVEKLFARCTGGTRQEVLQLIREEQILKFRVPEDVTGDTRA